MTTETTGRREQVTVPDAGRRSKSELRRLAEQAPDTLSEYLVSVPDAILRAELERRGWTVLGDRTKAMMQQIAGAVPELIADALRELGWTCTKPGEVRWINDYTTELAIVNGSAVGSVWDFRCHDDDCGVFCSVYGIDEWDQDHDYGTPEAARAAVEKALREQGR